MKLPEFLKNSFLNRFINRGHHRSVNARKNILASLIIRGGSIVISLMFVPLTIDYINAGRYGIWLTLSSIVGWFGFFDIGFGNGLRNKFAEAVAKDEHDLARIYVSTTYAVLSMIIAAVLIIFLFINPILDWTKILNAPMEMLDELSSLALIVFSFFCLQFVFQLITLLLTASQKPAKASLFNLLGSLLSLVIIFILTKTTSGNLIALGLTLGAAPVFMLVLASIWFYNGSLKKYAPSFSHIKLTYAKDLMGLGMKFFLIQIASVILYQTSNIIIAQISGPLSVASYNIAYKYFGIIPMVFSIVMMPYWSAFTEAWVKHDHIWIKNSINSLIKIWLGIAILTLVMLLFSNTIYRLWVGEQLKVENSVSIVIAIYVLINAWCSIFSQFLNGVGKIKLQLYSGVIGALINIPLAVFLGKQLGVYGVIMSTCLIAISSAIWSPIQYYKLIHQKASGIWNK
jgi:O-antigen/teichoic acid export membrane protein